MARFKSLAFCTSLAVATACFVEEPPTERRTGDWFLVSEQFTPSGVMGDGQLTGVFTVYIDRCPERAKGALGTCYAFAYKPRKPETDEEIEKSPGWVGVNWQSPPNNWGYLPGKIVEEGGTKVTFKARASKSGIVKVGAGGLGLAPDAERNNQPFPYHDEFTAKSTTCKLETDAWTSCTLPLKTTDGKDIFGDKSEMEVLGAFFWAYSCVDNRANCDRTKYEAVTFYFDDIRWE